MSEIKIGTYRHFKGNEYEIVGIAKHSETLEPMVVYRALYGEGGLWVRPARMWDEMVERDGKVFPRFTYIGDYQGGFYEETAFYAALCGNDVLSGSLRQDGPGTASA